MKLQLYNENKQSLGEVAFLQHSLLTTKIREADGYELSKALSIWITQTSLILGIKEPISNINKKDVVEMIVTEYKALSVDELYYAFKLERYGKLEPKIKGEGNIVSHFQMFNAEYVGKVLRKYREWKRDKLNQHNIEVKAEAVTVTQKEKQYWINRGVISCVDYFLENREIEEGKAFVYDILFDDGYLPKDNEYKKEKYKEAQECLRFELSNKKAKSRSEKNKIKEAIVNIENKSNSKVVSKAKILILNSFFRDLTKDVNKLKEFKDKYKY